MTPGLRQAARSLTRRPVLAVAQVVEAKARPLIKLRDPSDVKVVAEAIAGQAEIFVTGDQDLLSADVKVPFPIVTPRGFWEQLRG